MFSVNKICYHSINIIKKQFLKNFGATQLRMIREMVIKLFFKGTKNDGRIPGYRVRWVVQEFNVIKKYMPSKFRVSVTNIRAYYEMATYSPC